MTEYEQMVDEVEETTSVFLTDAAPGPANVMKDMETWGTYPGCAIRSIGAVMFDPYGGDCGEEFYMNITDESCEEAGLVKMPSTVEWWSRQSAEAQVVLLKDQRPLREAGAAFNAWFRKNRGIFVWSQGAAFDQPLWDVAMRAVGLSVPWKFWDSRCTRTAYDMGRFNNKSVRFSGVPHYALDDAKHQVVCVQKAYQNIQKE